MDILDFKLSKEDLSFKNKLYLTIINNEFIDKNRNILDAYIFKYLYFVNDNFLDIYKQKIIEIKNYDFNGGLANYFYLLLLINKKNNIMINYSDIFNLIKKLNNEIKVYHKYELLIKSKIIIDLIKYYKENKENKLEEIENENKKIINNNKKLLKKINLHWNENKIESINYI